MLEHIVLASAFTSKKNLLGRAELASFRNVCLRLDEARATDSTTADKLDELLPRLASREWVTDCEQGGEIIIIISCYSAFVH